MLIVMGTIFFLSHQSGDEFSKSFFPGEDKVAHFVVYGCLALAVTFAYSREFRQKRAVLVVVVTTLFCMLYGLSDEYHQSFIPMRTPSGWDLLMDTLGGFAAVTGWVWLERKRAGVKRQHRLPGEQ